MSGKTTVYLHTVTFSYDTEGRELTEEDQSDLIAQAEEHAKFCIENDFSSGELIAALDDGYTHIRGWWQIAA